MSHISHFRASPVGPGRIAHWDDANAGYSVGAVFARGATATPRYPRFRQWRHFDQGATSRCTAFSSMTLRECSEVRDPALFRLSTAAQRDAVGQSLYEEIQRIDRERHGLHFAEGATMLAACKAGVARGWWSEYRWCLSFDDALTVLRTAPLLIGVNWYTSFYRRDAEGIVRITPGAALDGGHAIVINHYDATRDLFRLPNTWGDGDWWIPGADMARLFAEDGEMAVVRELQAPIPA